MADADPQEIIEQEIVGALELQKSLEQTEQELMQDERFRQFLEYQKETQAKITTVWKAIEAAMIEQGVKSIKRDWGSITIVEKTNFDVIPEKLPAKYFKKVPDTAKIGNDYKLKNELPLGVELRPIKYLMKRLK